MLEQQPRGIDVSEEAREPERVEAVVTEGVGKCGVLVQQLAHAIGPSERRRFEDRELPALREPLRFVSVAAIDALKYVRHT